ncbi:MAG: ImmA/IrrE family metallo-endopeptidase, partial [Lachnospiraceae bacterium]|nr:ImmA/IrrE family metallo-endopeptidase [Lachnospiraceae bacterium]
QTALNIANSIETSPFDSKKIRTHLPELRSMTIQKPELFLPKMQKIFSENGVAFVLLPHLKNSGINGAVKWLNEEHVLLAINTRDLYVDTFWFSIFHEIKHVLQKKNKTVFISSKENFAEINRKLEDDADRFAANVLIPPEDYKRFSPTKDTTDDEIIAFANDIGIHPGIVAGRLEHEGIITQNRGKKFKEKYILKQNPHP